VTTSNPSAIGQTTAGEIDVSHSRRPGLPRLLVLTTGLPGAGKTTLARQVAVALELPLLSKDIVKERLSDILGVHDRAWSMKLGAAATNPSVDKPTHLKGCEGRRPVGRRGEEWRSAQESNTCPVAVQEPRGHGG